MREREYDPTSIPFLTSFASTFPLLNLEYRSDFLLMRSCKQDIDTQTAADADADAAAAAAATARQAQYNMTQAQ